MKMQHGIVIAMFAMLSVCWPSGSKAQTCPESKSVTGPQVQARMGSYKRQSVVDEREAIYNPPPGCSVLDCSPRVESSFGLTSFSVSTLAADSSFVSESSLDETYEEAFELAADLAADYGDGGLTAELNALLSQERQRHRQYLVALRSSHQACRLYARATGRGSLVDKGSSIVLTADVELCCGGTELQSEQRLQEYLEALVKNHLAEKGASTVPRGSCAQMAMECDNC